MTQTDSLRADDAAVPPIEITNQEATNAGVARATGVLALGNIASRVLGMAREIAVTGLFGASRATDAFYVATLVPRTLYDLLIGGQLNGAIIPVLSEVVTKDGRKALWQLVSVLLSLVTVVLSLLTLILIAFDKPVVSLIGSGYDAPTQALAAELLRITAPALIFMSLFAVLSGTLYALRSFTLPAFAGAVFNGCVVLGMVLLAPPLQVITTITYHGVTWAAGRPADGIRAAAFGWLIGAVVQTASQLPGLRGARVRFTLNWHHPALRQIARLYAPVMFSLVIDALVRFFSYNFASQTGESSLSYMNWATTLIQFPQGLVATAISIAILPTLARQSVLIARDGDRPFKDTLGLGLRLAITLIIPAASGLFVLATPVVRLLFEHGAFTPGDTVITALVLRLYLIGLPFAAIDLLLVYAFYARQDTLTPALIGLVSLVVHDRGGDAAARLRTVRADARRQRQASHSFLDFGCPAHAADARLRQPAAGDYDDQGGHRGGCDGRGRLADARAAGARHRHDRRHPAGCAGDRQRRLERRRVRGAGGAAAAGGAALVGRIAAPAACPALAWMRNR
ncbi:MAG: murein biosynthesis integral membrane protein MurJ [Anaerolineae bacterium]